MGSIVIVLVVGGFVGAAIAYLQSYFAKHDPAAGNALSVGAWFIGSATLIVWLLIDPSGILPPSLALAAAMSYLLTQEVCERRAERSEAEEKTPEVRRSVSISASNPRGPTQN